MCLVKYLRVVNVATHKVLWKSWPGITRTIKFLKNILEIVIRFFNFHRASRERVLVTRFQHAFSQRALHERVLSTRVA